jgi:hypothetical protein
MPSKYTPRKKKNENTKKKDKRVSFSSDFPLRNFWESVPYGYTTHVTVLSRASPRARRSQIPYNIIISISLSV